MLLRRELLASALPLRGVRFHDWWIGFVAASSGSIDDVDEPPVICRQHERSHADIMSLIDSSGKHKDGKARSSQHVDWLLALSSSPSKHLRTFQQSHWLAAACQGGWCCRAWCGWLREHALRVTAFNRRISFGRFALKQFFGMRWRMAIAGTHG